jgi:hypothetical protein
VIGGAGFMVEGIGWGWKKRGEGEGEEEEEKCRGYCSNCGSCAF